MLAGRRAFRRIPDERLPLDEYGSSDPADVDRTYVTQAAVIEGAYPVEILLGMSFLRQVALREQGGVLTLTAKY